MLAWSAHDAKKKTLTAFIRPTRCDNFRVRFTGEGRAVIKSFVREYDLGSEV